LYKSYRLIFFTLFIFHFFHLFHFFRLTMKIAIQGIAGSFHDIAARRYYAAHATHNDGSPFELLECATFEELADAVHSKRADAGMMAIENTIAGSILPNYALIQTYSLAVTGETYLQIRHNLLALPNQSIEDIQVVQAHPMAIIQCSEFLNKYPHIRVEEAFDTAGIAKKISEQKLKGVAAIAGYTAAELYNLDILAERLENNPKNFTRFLAVSRTPNPVHPAYNKASLAFRVSHTRGSLADALATLKHHNISLTKIQSMPVLGMPYEYMMHVDMTWDDLPDYEAAIKELDQNSYELRVFGVYEAGEKNMETLGRKRELPPPVPAKASAGAGSSAVKIDVIPWQDWVPKAKNPAADNFLVISGPCSAETEAQTLETMRQVAATGKASVLRAGIWKPRTRAGGFEGMGVTGLEWLQKAKEETGMMTAVEVATAQHVEDCLRHNVDIVWIGARTTGNPFSVQEIADAVKGTNLGVFVKNPISPDLELWIGALERLSLAGIRKLGAIHRGFATGEKTEFRNPPSWTIAMQFRERLPNMPLINDPSHITGKRDLLAQVGQKALDLGMDGFIIESHIDPDNAWTDAKQQITPPVLAQMLDGFSWRPLEKQALTGDQENRLEALRSSIDRLDTEFLELLAARMNVVREIGEYKKNNNMDVLQPERWNDLMSKRYAVGGKLNLADEFVKLMFEQMHGESLKVQEGIKG
jgi:chorismate mutase